MSSCVRNLLRVVDFLLLLPRVKPCDQPAPRTVLLGGNDGGGCRGARLDLGIVLLFQSFDALLQIAAGFDQILAGLIEFILVQFQLRLGKVELILNLVLLIRFGLCERGGEIICRLVGDRVELEGACVFYLDGEAVV